MHTTSKTARTTGRAPRRPPTSMWYHELENPDAAFVLPFYRYLAQLQRAAARDNEWFPCNGVGGGSGMSARSVKSQDAKMSAPHYVLAAARRREKKESGKVEPPSRMLVTDEIVEGSIKVRPMPVRLPDTVVFQRRMPRAWFTYDEDARMVLRLPPLSLDTVKIFDHFSSVPPNSDGLCAIYIASDPNNNGALVVEPLRPHELHDFLGGRPSILDKCPDGALQKYIPVSGKPNAIVEVVWSPSACGVYPASIQSIKDTPSSAISSGRSYGGGFDHHHHQQQQGSSSASSPSTRAASSASPSVSCGGLTVARLHDQAFGMIGYFLPDLLRTERRRIIRFSGIFRVDNEQRVWMMGCTCVRCAPANEPMNNAVPRMPMGLVRPAPFHAPRLDLTTPTLIVGKPPPERPANSPRITAEFIPFYFTPLELRKPFSVGTSVLEIASAALPRDLLFSALERENDLIHFARETDAFLGSEVSPSAPPSRGGAGGAGGGAGGEDGEHLNSVQRYYRGASMRFGGRRGFGSRGGAQDKKPQVAGDTESPEQKRRREFEASLEAQMSRFREFGKKTADLVTDTLLDGVSAGLNIPSASSFTSSSSSSGPAGSSHSGGGGGMMKPAAWTQFASTIIMDLDSEKWAQLSAAERVSMCEILRRCVGAVPVVLKDAGAAAASASRGRSPPLLISDRPEGERGRISPSRHPTLPPDPPTPAVFTFEELEQPKPATSAASGGGGGLVLSSSIPKKGAVINRFGRRTITPEAAQWLWTLQRSVETSVAEKAREIEATLRADFARQLEEEAAEAKRQEELLKLQLLEQQRQAEERERQEAEAELRGGGDNDDDHNQNMDSALGAAAISTANVLDDCEMVQSPPASPAGETLPPSSSALHHSPLSSANSPRPPSTPKKTTKKRPTTPRSKKAIKK